MYENVSCKTLKIQLVHFSNQITNKTLCYYHFRNHATIHNASIFVASLNGLEQIVKYSTTLPVHILPHTFTRYVKIYR